MPLVGLVTIWYRASREMARFLADLKAQQYPRLQPVFVIHQQTHEEIARLREEVPTALVLQPGANLGTAAGWNVGIAALLERDADYIGIWNVDVRPDPRCLRRLVEVMEGDPGVGACQPLLLYSDDPKKVQMYGGSISVRTGMGVHDYRGSSDLSLLPQYRDAQYLDGGTMLIRTAVLRRTGGFDERFYMYCEDSDISLRIQEAGYRTVAVRDARAWHFHRENRGDFPFPMQLFYETRNRFYLVRKHAGWSAMALLVGRVLWGLPRRLVYYARRRKLTLARAYLLGFVCGATGRTGKQGLGFL